MKEHTKMKVTVLGSGSAYGCPMVFNSWRNADPSDERNRRSRPSVCLEVAGKTLIIDVGPDFREQINRNRITNIDAVLLTHPHYDHISSLPELIRASALLGHNIPIFANAETMADLRVSYAFMFRVDEGAILSWHEIPDIGEFAAAGVKLRTFQVPHHHWHCSAFRCGDFAYLTDWESISPQGLQSLHGVKTLLVECNNGLYPEHNGHSDLEAVKRLAAQITPQRVVLTHLSARVDYAETAAHLPTGFELAYDGLVLDI